MASPRTNSKINAWWGLIVTMAVLGWQDSPLVVPILSLVALYFFKLHYEQRDVGSLLHLNEAFAALDLLLLAGLATRLAGKVPFGLITLLFASVALAPLLLHASPPGAKAQANPSLRLHCRCLGLLLFTSTLWVSFLVYVELLALPQELVTPVGLRVALGLYVLLYSREYCFLCIDHSAAPRLDDRRRLPYVLVGSAVGAALLQCLGVSPRWGLYFSSVLFLSISCVIAGVYLYRFLVPSDASAKHSQPPEDTSPEALAQGYARVYGGGHALWSLLMKLQGLNAQQLLALRELTRAFQKLGVHGFELSPQKTSVPPAGHLLQQLRGHLLQLVEDLRTIEYHQGSLQARQEALRSAALGVIDVLPPHDPAFLL